MSEAVRRDHTLLDKDHVSALELRPSVDRDFAEQSFKPTKGAQLREKSICAKRKTAKTAKRGLQNGNKTGTDDAKY